jgi:hypothetical protein
MGEREPLAPLLADAGLLTGSPEGPGDVTLTAHLVTPAELATMNRVAEELQLAINQRSGDIFTSSPPLNHPVMAPAEISLQN